ncbi:alpha/beta hydrolase [Luteimonas gilva]|uniref:Alpha/beta hydrolase n=1 Tax=Luteimonas gilva TaxID=2572684 RepID=A0A4U5JSE6_9GAMM|nr:alpha/beta hydrolase [Luteimonas gilva]TKR30957.1 alpha/beta hydrolase [Luteimonas gilva]
MKSALLLHGAGGGAWEWNLWRGVLQAHGVEVAAPDLQPAAAGLSATAWSDYLAQAQEALLALPRPRAAIGASLGGLLAAAIAEAADALVLVNPLPPAPWHGQVPQRVRAGVIPWRREARLSSTRRALPDADAASALYAFRRWRDESGLALREAAAGVAIARPHCRVLCIVSEDDEDVPAAVTAAWAQNWSAELIRLDSASHVGALLGRSAADAAGQTAAWLSAR